MNPGITEAELSQVWWMGTLKGALKGLGVGLLVGAAAALTLQFVLIPLLPAIGLPSIAESFAGFLTLTPSAVAGWAGGIVPLASFSAIPLAIFSGVSGMLGNLLGSGNDAVNAYKQDVEHRMNEARISQIETREMALENYVSRPSPMAQKIIAAGPRNDGSFRDAEDARSSSPAAGPTIH